MKLIQKTNAMQIFYYLMVTDGEATPDELEKFDDIGRALDSSRFPSYRDALIETCKNRLQVDIDDEYYDVVQECMDSVLVANTECPEDGIPPRLLIWNMLVVAMSNDEYSGSERRIISHAVRTLQIPKSVFYEMEQLIKTAASVEKEKVWITTTDKPDEQVRSIVDELDKRQRIVMKSAHALIDDEIEIAQIYEIRPDFIDASLAYISNKVAPIAAKVGESVIPVATRVSVATQKTFSSVKTKLSERVLPVASEIGAKAGKLLSGKKNKTKKADNSEE